MKSKLIGSALLALAALAIPSAAMATLVPGQYRVANIQNVCLRADGSWYYTTFAGNVGRWKNITAKKAILYGNYASNVGNDSMIVRNNTRVDWTEWRDNFVSEYFLNNKPFVYQKSTCDSAPSRPASPDANPMKLK